MEGFFDRLRDLAARDEPEAAFELLSSALRGSAEKEACREALVQSGRLSRLRTQERRGLLSPEQVARERARLGDALLQLVDELEARTDAARRPFPTVPVRLEPPPEAGLEKIFGAGHLKSIAWLARGLEAARSVCRLVAPRGLGTGFLIEGGWVLTNHHVLADPSEAEESTIELNFQEDASGRMEEHRAYRLSAAGFRCDRDLDFALARVEPEPSEPAIETWGTLAFETGPPPEVGEHVAIIQHPGGGAKQIALTANQVVNVYGHRLQYTTDTLPGSSGSPVFNDDWKVVALHHAGGNLIKNDRGDRMYANEGILIAEIAGALRPPLPGG
jgi:endonuclease G